jgi:hypothetical protein
MKISNFQLRNIKIKTTELQSLRDKLLQYGVKGVAMESASIYRP